jgi:hypothetical protein
MSCATGTHGKKHWSEGRFASLTARIKLAHGRYERSPQLQRFLTAGTLAASVGNLTT